jgi:predicted transposase YbfD/YdcC
MRSLQELIDFIEGGAKWEQLEQEEQELLIINADKHTVTIPACGCEKFPEHQETNGHGRYCTQVSSPQPQDDWEEELEKVITDVSSYKEYPLKGLGYDKAIKDFIRQKKAEWFQEGVIYGGQNACSSCTNAGKQQGRDEAVDYIKTADEAEYDTLIGSNGGKIQDIRIPLYILEQARHVDKH